jgi:hypothetical protein
MSEIINPFGTELPKEEEVKAHDMKDTLGESTEAKAQRAVDEIRKRILREQGIKEED